jgi:lipoprotein NlpI
MCPHCVLVQNVFLCFIICHYFLEGDPNNYLTYFKRGTVYLALGKSKFALMDLDKVLQLKPDFTSVSIFSIKELHREVKVNSFSLCVINRVMIMQSAFRYPLCNNGTGHCE